MARLKAVFFDMGGTLLDMKADKSSHLLVLEAAKARYGLDLSVEELHRRIVQHLERFEPSQAQHWKPILELTEEAYREQMAELGIDIGNRDSEWFMKTYKATYRKGVRLAAGAMDVLRGAKLLGLHVGILSDVDEEWAAMLVDSLRIRPLLDSVTTSQAVGVGKPNPKMFYAALKKSRCEAGEAILVGDSLERDIRGAKAIGMKAAHLAPAPSAEADYQLRSMGELLPILRTLTGAGP
jgi:HAD superfamily hydrolase (TIGR01549 family)